MNINTKEYDFNLPIKFSAKGFELFCEQLELKQSRLDRVNDLISYQDSYENWYCFEQTNHIRPIKSQYEGVYVTFKPNYSDVRHLNAKLT